MVISWQFHCWVLGSIPGQRTKIPQAAQSGQEKKREDGEEGGEDIIEIQMDNSYMKKMLNSYIIKEKSEVLQEELNSITRCV